ncbi:MAG TPA: metallophosphoesterase family protein, partial [Marmoricola sp.]|nr:metallophosphoesterase family protein [Marmoricola sp.]
MRLARALVPAAVLAAVIAATPLSGPAAAEPDGRSRYTFAVIGDVPYGADQIAAFPGWIRQINADPDVRSVVHLGDIKNGSSVCSDAYFDQIRADFDTFRDPLVYTPGDNEWTDCHRANNGAYNPLERLDRLRQVFFDEPGRTLGQKQLRVETEAGFPENVLYHRARVTFAAANVPGSDNGLQPWTGLGLTQPTPEQTRAVADRTTADIALLRRAFAEAKQRGDRGVVVMQQADMFDPTYTPTWGDIGAFQPWVQAIVDEASHFRGQVYLLNG